MRFMWYILIVNCKHSSCWECLQTCCMPKAYFVEMSNIGEEHNRSNCDWECTPFWNHERWSKNRKHTLLRLSVLCTAPYEEEGLNTQNMFGKICTSSYYGLNVVPYCVACTRKPQKDPFHTWKGNEYNCRQYFDIFWQTLLFINDLSPKDSEVVYASAVSLRRRMAERTVAAAGCVTKEKHNTEQHMSVS